MTAEDATTHAELGRLAAGLGRQLGDAALAARAAALAKDHAPDERLALAFALKLAERDAASVARALGDVASARDLLFCLGASEFVANYLSVAADTWSERFESARTSNVESILSRISAGPGTIPADRRAAAESLAAFKHDVFAQIAIADLLGRITVADTARLMSRLADQCIAGALRAAAAIVRPASAMLQEFCVVAMGKLGAEELNLSSDVDLLYVLGQRDSTAVPQPVTRAAELLTELLADAGFRVDLRLRPGGRAAPLVTTLDGALSFYENFGQTWERAALLRARPVAGATGVARRLIDELSRFVFRRYLDFDTLRQLRAMKRQIEQELHSPAMIERDIKLGRGGIRELEFIVQSLVLIYGGRDPRLRCAATVGSLELLAEHGYLPAALARSLADAYLFLRDVEHKLQVVAALQTHSLPADGAGMQALAARMGYGKSGRGVERFVEAAARHRALVASEFRETLAGGGDEAAQRAVSPAAAAAWRAALDPEGSVLYLESLGCRDPVGSAAHLEYLARGPAHAPASPRRRELLDRLGALLLDELAALPDPDLALMNLAAFIAAVGARTSFLALLEEHPPTRAALLRLFASSRYLSSLFIRHPEMLDTLVRSDLARQRRPPAELASELKGIIAACPDFEARLDALRAFRHQEFLRIAIADLGGSLDLHAVETELTALAETVLRESLDVARAEVASSYAAPPGLSLSVVALGRMGAGEMSYNSDLDLLFVYGDGGDVTSGGREIASRIMQKLIVILESRTREGYAYKLDLRLRPSGNQGPLVTSLQGFIDYHERSSALWERQALIRARVVAGDEPLGAQVEKAIEGFVYGRRLTGAQVNEIAAMRYRMEREIGAEDSRRLNIKQGRGGIVDIEFLVQMLALRYGKDRPALRQRATHELIRAIAETAVLEPADAAALADDYRFLAQLENRLRIETDEAAWAVPTDPARLAPLARRMGFEGADAAGRLLEELELRRDRVRRLFERVFAAEARRAA
jgi:glutamate-ammonia-ligase adenylyltransferase